MAETLVDQKQISGLVRERNSYRRLLVQSQYALGVLRDTPINDGNSRGETTRSLAQKIGAELKSYDSQSGYGKMEGHSGRIVRL